MVLIANYSILAYRRDLFIQIPVLVVTEEALAMITNAGPSDLLSRTGLFLMVLLMTEITSAGCIKDLRGEVCRGAGRCTGDSEVTVRCSRHHDGDAVITSNVQAFCSSEFGGAVLMDNRGRGVATVSAGPPLQTRVKMPSPTVATVKRPDHSIGAREGSTIH